MSNAAKLERPVTIGKGDDDVEFSVDVDRGSSRMPRAEDDDHLMAMGITRSLMEPFQSATEGMGVPVDP
jgi:hypothetical protein